MSTAQPPSPQFIKRGHPLASHRLACRMTSFPTPYSPSPPLMKRRRLPCTMFQVAGKSGLGFLWATAQDNRRPPSEGHTGPWVSQQGKEKVAQQGLEGKVVPSMAHREQQQIDQSSDGNEHSAEEPEGLPGRSVKCTQDASLVVLPKTGQQIAILIIIVINQQ